MLKIILILILISTSSIITSNAFHFRNIFHDIAHAVHHVSNTARSVVNSGTNAGEYLVHKGTSTTKHIVN